MNPAEYEIMARVEDHHWWYLGLRDLLTGLLRSDRLRPTEVSYVLDAGCGSGANLRMLGKVLAPHSLAGFDNSPLAVALASSRVPNAEIYQCDIRSPAVRHSPIDLLLCSDVIYMVKHESAQAGLLQLIDHLRPGGLFVLHVPALNWLFSRHDAAVHTRHRYNRGEIHQLLQQLGLKQELLTYRMTLLLPVLIASRLPSLICGARTDSDNARSDLTLPRSPLNSLLRRIVQLENRLILHGVRFPVGSSLIAVGRKL